MTLRMVIAGFTLSLSFLFFLMTPAGKSAKVEKEKFSREIVSAALSGNGIASRPGSFKTFPIAEEKRNFRIASVEGLSLTSRAASVMDVKNQRLIYQKNAEQKFPIASLTKLMTAIIFIETKTDLNKEVIFSQEDNKEIEEYFAPGEAIGKLYLNPGETLKIKDLIYSSLVGSANNATMALVRSTGLSIKEFVRRMNERAQVLGLKNTFFKEPSGLDSGNVSTASDIARLADYAFKNNLISKITAAKKYSFQTLNTKKWHTIKNTNWLIGGLNGIFGSKTGYLNEAGYCLTTAIRNKDKEVIITLLGVKDNKTRFEELKRVAQWILKN